jgi:CheY-like chemotaxis protein
MKILIVDRDDLTRQLIRSKLEPLGYSVSEEPDKNRALDKVAKEEFSLIFIDPSPLTNARPVILNMRRALGHYAYISLLSETILQEEALKAGANDLLAKPLDAQILQERVKNAERLTQLVRRIGDTSEDFLSAGGVIAKSAFNQLFLSGIDRADRYGERTFVLFIAVSNYDKILKMSGAYAADYAVAKLCQHLVRIRRQSDIIGQTARHEYALLLQRPIYETEPMEAANRFALALEDLGPVAAEILTPIEITVTLVDLPIGAVLAEHVVTHDPRPGTAA